MQKEIYIVSGFPRSGTSMMMRAIEVGGIPACYHTTKDREWPGTPDYRPAPFGYYELDDLHNVKDWSIFQNRALKVIRCDIRLMDPAQTYRSIYMHRNPKEIRDSFERMEGSGDSMAFDFIRGYEESVSADIYQLSKLGSVTRLDYGQVVAHPKKEFAKIGWPIDLEKAASTVDPKYYRNRRSA